MFRFVLSTFVIYMFLNTANAQPPQISARTQEAIFVMQSLCLATSDISIEAKGDGAILILKKGLKVKGEYKETEVTSLLKKLESEVGLLAEADNIRECTKPHIEKILDSILGQGTPKKRSTIVPRDSLYAELVLTDDPIEYAKGIVCKRPDIRQQLTLGYQLRQLGKGVDPSFKKQVDEFLFSSFGLNQSGLIENAIMELNPNDIDCGVERICDVRGSVPIKVNTDTMQVFEIPMRQVKVLDGHCQNKVGFVNERFIDF